MNEKNRGETAVFFDERSGERIDGYRFDPVVQRIDFPPIASIQMPIAWFFLLSHQSRCLSHGSSFYRIHPDAYRMDLSSITSIPLPITWIFLYRSDSTPTTPNPNQKTTTSSRSSGSNLITYGLLLSKASADEPRSCILDHLDASRLLTSVQALILLLQNQLTSHHTYLHSSSLG